MPNQAKTAAEYDRQVAARAVCFTAVLVAGRKRQRWDFLCGDAISRYCAFAGAITKAKSLTDRFGRRGMVYAVDRSGHDVHLAEAVWPELMNTFRDIALPKASP